MKKKLVKRTDLRKDKKNVEAYAGSCAGCGSVPSWDYLNVKG